MNPMRRATPGSTELRNNPSSSRRRMQCTGPTRRCVCGKERAQFQLRRLPRSGPRITSQGNGSASPLPAYLECRDRRAHASRHRLPWVRRPRSHQAYRFTGVAVNKRDSQGQARAVQSLKLVCLLVDWHASCFMVYRVRIEAISSLAASPKDFS